MFTKVTVAQVFKKMFRLSKRVSIWWLDLFFPIYYAIYPNWQSCWRPNKKMESNSQLKIQDSSHSQFKGLLSAAAASTQSSRWEPAHPNAGGLSLGMTREIDGTNQWVIFTHLWLNIGWNTGWFQWANRIKHFAGLCRPRLNSSGCLLGGRVSMEPPQLPTGPSDGTTNGRLPMVKVRLEQNARLPSL